MPGFGGIFGNETACPALPGGMECIGVDKIGKTAIGKRK